MKTHARSRTCLYRRWIAIKTRCENSNFRGYHNYGGRGIKVCERWQEFDAFAEDMGATFSPDLELDRINVHGDYEPSNCRWISHRENNRNKRTNHKVEFQGKCLTLAEWQDVTGIKQNTILCRIRRGWPLEQVFNTDDRRDSRKIKRVAVSDRSGFSQRLKVLRLQKNMTFRELSELSRVSQTYICAMEKGRFYTTVESGIMNRLAASLGVSVDYLVQG